MSIADREQAAYVVLDEAWRVIAQTKTFARETKLILADARAELEAKAILEPAR